MTTTSTRLAATVIKRHDSVAPSEHAKRETVEFTSTLLKQIRVGFFAYVARVFTLICQRAQRSQYFKRIQLFRRQVRNSDERDKGIAIRGGSFVSKPPRTGFNLLCAPRRSPTNKRRGGFLTATNHSAISSVSADRIFRSPTRGIEIWPGKRNRIARPRSAPRRAAVLFSSSTATRVSLSRTRAEPREFIPLRRVDSAGFLCKPPR